MAEILLTSEKFVKSVTNISDNLDGKYLQAGIREAGEIYLENILGSSMLSALKAMVADRSINDEANAAYKQLLDVAQYFLAYTAIVQAMQFADYKIGNAGVVKTPDQNVVTATDEERDRKVEFYQAKADAYAFRLQKHVLNNSELFPELDECACEAIRSNLYSAATSGIFLGGARGKVIGRAGR